MRHLLRLSSDPFLPTPSFRPLPSDPFLPNPHLLTTPPCCGVPTTRPRTTTGVSRTPLGCSSSSCPTTPTAHLQSSTGRQGGGRPAGRQQENPILCTSVCLWGGGLDYRWGCEFFMGLGLCSVGWLGKARVYGFSPASPPPRVPDPLPAPPCPSPLSPPSLNTYPCPLVPPALTPPKKGPLPSL